MIQPATDLETAFRRTIAKACLREVGHTYRSAAGKLGRSYQHLSDVLNGKRESRTLINRVLALKPHKKSRR